MGELATRARAAGSWLVREPSPASIEHGLDVLETRIRRHRRVRAATIATFATVVVGIVGFAIMHAVPTSSSPTIGVATKALELGDHASVTPLQPDTELRAAHVSEREVTVEMKRGAARFVVKKRPQRTFRVRAGDAMVEVLGTIFSVSRSGQQVSVSVQRGRVKVTWRGGTWLLVKGQTRRFPPPLPALPEPPVKTKGEVTPADGPAQRRPATARHAAVKRGRVRALRRAAAKAGAPKASAPETPKPAHSGGHAPSAADEPGRKPTAPAPSPAVTPPTSESAVPNRAGTLSTDELLRAADLARLSGHRKLAVSYLQQALSRKLDPTRKAIVSFTLGRLQLKLRRYLQAANSFGLAARADPRGPLVEDAMARGVQALHRAGKYDRARVAAKRYLRRYPRGRRANLVRRIGGLE